MLFATSFVTTLFPFMFLRRRLDAKKKDFNPVAEIALEKWLDVAFGAMLNLERTIIGAGLSLPFGGSCFVVGRKAKTDQN